MFGIKAGLYGLIVADALGVPAESRTREDLRRNPITEMVGGGLHQQPAGYWSDDSSMFSVKSVFCTSCLYRVWKLMLMTLSEWQEKVQFSGL